MSSQIKFMRSKASTLRRSCFKGPIFIVAALVLSLSSLNIECLAAPLSLPSKKTNPNTPSEPSSLRRMAERELSLDPWQNRIKTKSSQEAPLQVENLPTPPSVVPTIYTETALTVSNLQPEGTSSLLGKQTYDLSLLGSMPVFSLQLQHWLYKDFERLQHVGFILGTSVGEKTINVALANGYTLSQMEILYTKIQAGLSLEKTLKEDRLHLGLSAVFVEELLQQNAPTNEARWSRWNPALAVAIQGKLQVSRHWYTLAELHNQWPLSDNTVTPSRERLHLGLGYYL